MRQLKLYNNNNRKIKLYNLITDLTFYYFNFIYIKIKIQSVPILIYF